jgi:hypothetical protein
MLYTPSTLHCGTPVREVAMHLLETDPMTERLQFVQDALSDPFTMAEGVLGTGSADRLSRTTGNKCIARHVEEGRRVTHVPGLICHLCARLFKLTQTSTAWYSLNHRTFWQAEIQRRS